MMAEDLDVDIVVVDLTVVNVDPSSISEGQKGAEAQQVNGGDKGEH